MAYAATVSLVHILEQLKGTPDEPSKIPYANPQIELLYDKVSSIKISLPKIFPVPLSKRDVVTKLETDLRDVLYRAEDAIEFFVNGQILSPASSSESPGALNQASIDFLQELERAIKKVDPIVETAKKMADEYEQASKLLSSESGEAPVDQKEDEEDDYGMRAPRIIGQEKDKEKLVNLLEMDSSDREVIPVVGMPGIGKTTLARSIYDDERVKENFPVRAWVTIPQDYRIRDIFAKILESMEVGSGSNKNSNRESESLDNTVYHSFYNLKYLLVIDDMWDSKIWDEIQRVLPDNKAGSRILMTSRYPEVIEIIKPDGDPHVMQPLNEDDSWELLCIHAFRGGICPPHLKELGLEISKNCGGLPLSLTVVGGQLYTEEQTERYWKIVAEDVNSAAAKGKESYLEILFRSYNHLPYHLKGCFLYMGAFPEDSDIPFAKLVKLWVAEGILPLSFPRKSSSQQPENLEQAAEMSLKNLVDRNLLAARKRSSAAKIKTCGMHDILRDISVREARLEKYFHAISRYSEEFPQDTYHQRRVSVHKNILMCMKEVYDISQSITHARSLVYSGSHHNHPMPFVLTYELLRVLDAFTVYFIEFPSEILKLTRLKYLSFTYNGKIPSKISKLKYLQILIIRQQPKIIFLGASVLPVEIWNLPLLRHLQFMESELPNPSDAQNPVVFVDLQSLSKVNARCFTKDVLARVPNLKKLGMWIDAPGSLDFYLDKLHKLEIFEFVVLNPIPGRWIDFQPRLVFPDTLKKLSLSGCGLPWENMKIIGQLPNLEVMKLREFAFQGEEWEPTVGEFKNLRYLFLEALDLQEWTAEDRNFPRLKILIIRHCYDLLEIPEDIGVIGGLQLIDVVDCNPGAMESAKLIKEKQMNNNKGLKVRISCSWE